MEMDENPFPIIVCRYILYNQEDTTDHTNYYMVPMTAVYRSIYTSKFMYWVTKTTRICVGKLHYSNK